MMLSESRSGLGQIDFPTATEYTSSAQHHLMIHSIGHKGSTCKSSRVTYVRVCMCVCVDTNVYECVCACVHLRSQPTAPGQLMHPVGVGCSPASHRRDRPAWPTRGCSSGRQDDPSARRRTPLSARSVFAEASPASLSNPVIKYLLCAQVTQRWLLW